MNTCTHLGRARQQGMALLIGLILLIVLSITALTAMQLVANQNRVAGNAWGSQMSLSTGEAALMTAQDQLLNGNVLENFAANTAGAYTFDADSVPQWAQSSFTWTGSNVLAGGAFTNAAYPQSQAQVIIEKLPAVIASGGQLNCTSYNCSPQRVYRVTANARGPDGKLPALLQATSVQ